MFNSTGSAYAAERTMVGKVAEAPIENLGPTFTVEVPRYGITAIVIPKAP